ncbi:DUF7169 domain-containing protein [Curtobacterium sp. MCBA15_009]|uniref:DUF7169 domain-containing protein n=1 Tax=Curtobacterium sp. MCBA15_009 TaxID=1898737 RepID=UPI001113E3B1|nr:hypothetical protein [Curtobacterium sp. MCBA15_009]
MTDILEAASASFLRAQRELIFAKEAQWDKGQTPALPEDTTERSKGTVSDPVPAIVDDTRRKKLRASVLETEAAQHNLLRVMDAAANHLERALQANG